MAKIVGEPYALIGHVRFDEGKVLVNCSFINSWVPTYSTWAPWSAVRTVAEGVAESMGTGAVSHPAKKSAAKIPAANITRDDMR